jgi:hypothetical protein
MKGIAINLDGLSVMLGMPAGRDLHPLTVKSLLGTTRLLQTMGIPYEPAMVAGCSVVQWARDEIADLFKKSSCSRLFWLDSDMVWEPEDFVRMLALSQIYDVVCATYPAKIDSQTTFYVNRDKDAKLERNEHGLIEIWGVGLGFTVVSRSVMEALYVDSPLVYDEAAGRELSAVFRVQPKLNGDRLVRAGEDMAFFADIRDAGFKVWLDPQVDLGHIGVKKYTGSVRDALQIN